MYHYTFKIAIRNLLRQGSTTLINSIGLVVSLLTIFIITVWVVQEFSYDKHHSNANRIYRLTAKTGSKEMNDYWHFARMHQTWRREFPDFFAEVEDMVELAPSRKTIVTINENKFYESTYGTDSSLFNVFDIPLLYGNPETALVGTNKVIVSESFAEKHFQSANAMGEDINLYGEYITDSITYTISGVFKDIPATAHFHTNLFTTYSQPSGMNHTEWSYTYLLTKEGANQHQLESQFSAFIEDHVPQWQQEHNIEIHLQPLTNIHLYSHIEREMELNGNIRHVRTFILIAFGVFIVALINFINLRTIIIKKKAFDYKLNRVIGAKHRHVVLQLAIESAVMTFLSILLAVLVLKPVLTILNQTHLFTIETLSSATYSIIAVISISFFLVMATFAVLPYILFVRQTKLSDGGHSNYLSRKKSGYHAPLLVAQFAISMVVIVMSLVNTKQNNYMFNNSLGTDAEDAVILHRKFWSEENKVLLFKDILSKNKHVNEYALSFETPGSLNKDARRVKTSLIEGGYTEYALSISPCSENYFSFFNVPLIAGRFMKPYIEGQKFEEYVINKSAMKKMGFSNPEDVLGADFTVEPFFDGVIHGGRIVGVVEDFNTASLHHPIQPIVFFQKPIWHSEYLARPVPGQMQAMLSSLQAEWQTVYPNAPFDYEMLSDNYAAIYKQDKTVSKIFNLMSVLCIVISCIGLFGVVSILILSKVKEIGIRKVNGAKSNEILIQINTNFLKQVFVAFVIACPVSYFIMQKWLENYAYKTEISWWVFALAGFIALLISVVTVSIKTWHTVRRNPVEALRYE